MLYWIAKRLRETHEKDRLGQKGFTLVELLIVIIIISVLAAIAIPAYLSQANRAREALVDAELRNAGQSVLACMTENAAGSCDSDAELDAYGFNPSTKTARAWSQPAANEVEVTVTHNDNNTITGTFNSSDGYAS